MMALVSALARHRQHSSSSHAARSSLGVFTAVAGVHEPGDNYCIPRAMGHSPRPASASTSAGEESCPSSLADTAPTPFRTTGSDTIHKLVNATAAALLAASELAGGARTAKSRENPHRRVVEMLDDSDAGQLISGAAGDRPDASRRYHPRSLGGGSTGRHRDSGASAQAVWPRWTAISSRSWRHPSRRPSARAKLASSRAPIICSRLPRVLIRLGLIDSVKGETHTATLVLDSFFHNHHLSELKPWLLGAKSGGSSTNHRGRQVFEGPPHSRRLKLHYVAMTRPTHLLCLAMRKDAFGEGSSTHWRVAAG